jgi:hypothetical protein
VKGLKQAVVLLIMLVSKATIEEIRILAPEVLSEEEYDNSVDMWAVGVITYIMFAYLE